MYSIPFKAFNFGASSPFQGPVAYGKSRLAGSKKITYILCSKAGVMPGQPWKFTKRHLSKPGLGESISNNSYIADFKLSNQKSSQEPNIEKYPQNRLDIFTYDQYSPHDDESYKTAIAASYWQVYGNFHAMESERPIDCERRLRNGDISIREFIRSLAKSSFYKFHYFENITSQRSIEFNFKHILGRPPVSQKEIRAHIELLNDKGFEEHIDLLIDSNEYNKNFGEYIVPYQRVWNSPCGAETISFKNSRLLSRGFATSDNAIKGEISTNPLGNSVLLNNLANKEIIIEYKQE